VTPLLGPFGMNQGTTNPIIPQKAVITMNGIAIGGSAMMANEFRLL